MNNKFLKESIIFISVIIIFLPGDIQNFQEKPSYLPLEIGNKWFYSHYDSATPYDSTRIDEVWEVKSKVDLFEKPFFVIRKNYYDKRLKHNEDSIYYCLSSDTLFSFNPNNNSLFILAIFNKNTFTFRVLEGVYNMNQRILRDSTFLVSYYLESSQDSGFQKVFKQGVGIIDEKSSWGFGSKLIRYTLK